MAIPNVGQQTQQQQQQQQQQQGQQQKPATPASPKPTTSFEDLPQSTALTPTPGDPGRDLLSELVRARRYERRLKDELDRADKQVIVLRQKVSEATVESNNARALLDEWVDAN